MGDLHDAGVLAWSKLQARLTLLIWMVAGLLGLSIMMLVLVFKIAAQLDALG